jgi:hypothetical protein
MGRTVILRSNNPQDRVFAFGSEADIMLSLYPSGVIGKITDERSGTFCDRSNFFTGQRAMHAALKGVPPWPN